MKLSTFTRFLMILALLVSVGLMVGCSGDDGATGPQGPAGSQGPAGPAGPAGEDLTQAIEPESCSVCHANAGTEGHQGIYDKYLDESQLAMEITEVKSVAAGGAFNVTMTVSIMKGGLPFIDADGLPTLEQQRFYVQGYDSATRSYPNAMNASLGNPKAVAGQPGVYKVTATGVSYAPENSNAQAYAYIAQGLLDTEKRPGGHIDLYDDLASAGMTFGDADEYESYANVEGCEKCHGTPYRKHGYREAAVAGLPTFSSCKVCHMDDRAGGHEDWQQIVDDPVAWGNGDSAKVPEYAYTRRIMNDVHMSHAMEFPYPQKMSNCITCHEGKMDKVTADEFFVAETCKSCHGVQPRPDEYNELVFYEKKAPSLETLWPASHNLDLTCTNCHGSNGFAPTFGEIHSGYDAEIYDEDGVKYSELYTAEITSLSMADGKVDIKFTGSTDLMTAPQVLVSFYGYGTKQFLVSSHSRDANSNRMEKTIGSDNPLFTEEADSVQGNWHVVLDTTAYASDPTIGEMIDSGAIRRLEVSVRPTVKVDDQTVATNAVSKTLELASNSIDDDYFKGANAVAKVEGCNKCHDALATSFHSGDRGGDITVCKHCHVPSSGGSHLEMQSRELASYVHAIHSFQAFDTDEVNFDDPVEAKLYGIHIEHTFPNFSIKNCEACHVKGTFDPVDQSESLPAVLSASYENETWDRSISFVPSYVTGPSSRACGACHRTELINEDEAGELASFFQHTKQGGYLVEEGDWDAIVSEIMALFD